MNGNKKPRSRKSRYPVSRPVAIRRRADSECPECFGYPFHASWCKGRE